MIPTSTNATIRLGKTIPANSDSVAIMIHKQTTSADVAKIALPAAHRAAAKSLLDAKAVTGRSNELTVHLVENKVKPARLIVIGTGNGEKLSAECLREGAATLAKSMRRLRIGSCALIVPEIPKNLPGTPDGPQVGAMAGLSALAEGFLLGNFDFEEYKGAAARQKEQESKQRESRNADLTLVTSQNDTSIRAAIERGKAIADGQNFARTLASRPGNAIRPPTLAQAVQKMAREVGLAFKALDEKQMAKLGMGGILAVGSGSIEVAPPRMIALEWKGQGARGKGQASRGSPRSPLAPRPSPLLIIGKAITFDTGGISIKPADKMGRMIFDKCGGMAVLGLMYALAKLKLPIHVVGILASAENHISERAYRPGDILKMYNGVTVEVTNTDAEGRLVLGDALAWGIETYKPRAVVDLATLTGGCVVALGKTMAGLMANDDGLAKEIDDSTRRAGEKVWRLPIGEDQRDQIKSDPADIVNSAGRDGSPLQGGAFLSFFIPDGKAKVPWVHLDIAGVADTERELPLYAKGATGWGVRTLVEWVSSHA